MPDHEALDLTKLLRRWSEGSNEALEQLAFRVEGELRRLARHYLRSEQKGHLLESGALVNEAWMRLIGWRNDAWQNREHFFGVAARMMRLVLADEARKRNYAKRGGDNFRVSLSEANQPNFLRPWEFALEIPHNFCNRHFLVVTRNQDRDFDWARSLYKSTLVLPESEDLETEHRGAAVYPFQMTVAVRFEGDPVLQLW